MIRDIFVTIANSPGRTYHLCMSPKNPVVPVFHIRRCHVCGCVNELKGSAIMKCSECGKHFAPFYFFDENELSGIGDDQPYYSIFNQTEDTRPIYGLSTYWE